MNHLDSEYLKRGIDTLELEEFEHPQRLERLLFDDEDHRSEEIDDSISGWLESAEKWSSVPRRTAFVSNYFEADEEILDNIEYRMDLDTNTPALDGAAVAWSAIKAQNQVSNDGFGAVIGLPVKGIKGDENINQALGPSGEPVEMPEWISNDDWYSDLEEEDYVGMVVDDETVYARHLKDNTVQRREGSRSDELFWRGFDETVENYTSLI